MAFKDAGSMPLVRPEDVKRAVDGRVRAPVRQILAEAGRLFDAGRLDRAEHFCRQVIAAKPDNAEAHNLLGAVQHRLGNLDAAAAEMREAIRCNGQNGAYHANLGEIERNRGDLAAAAKALAKAIRIDPRSFQAHNNLGIVHFDEADFDKAAVHYRKAIAIHPDYAEAHNNLGNALRALGKRDEALQSYERAIDLKENYPEAYNNLASVLRDQKRIEEAEAAYVQALSLRPDYLDASDNLASLLISEERHEDALRYLLETLKRTQTRVATLVLVGRAQVARRSWAQAETALGAALKQQPENAEALILFGQVCHELDRFDEAIASYTRALELRPDSIEGHNMLAVVLKSVGRLDDARETLHRALAIQPNAPGIYSNLADLEKFTPEHPLFLGMLDLLAKAEAAGAEERLTSLHFALGKAYDDMGEHIKAFDHFAAGARNKRATIDYDEARITAFIDSVRDTFGAEYFANRPFAGNPTDVPIFIVGMPRSGSTLTEQILASHPRVHGAGEIKTLSQALNQLRQRLPHLPKYPQIMGAMKAGQFAALASSYLGTVSAKAPDAGRITDKLLSNYYHVGLINTLFPNAKIIHTVRDPVDTCLSAFTKLFKDEMAHSYDLSELGRYYLRYQGLMDHWRAVLPPGTMLDVQYEDVVANAEARARELIAFVGLEWDDRCLSFHETVRPVKTASVSQVRKPLYNTSVERWRRYGDRLQPLVEALQIAARPVDGVRQKTSPVT